MNSNLPLPKYHQIYLVLREQLIEGAYRDGLPGDFSLMRQFGVARITVRKALSQLVDEGLIIREPGKGTKTVTPSRSNQSSAKSQVQVKQAKLSGLLENLVSMGLNTQVKVLSVQILNPPEEVCNGLQIASYETAQKAVRVRSTEDGPLSYITTWVPADIAKNFGKSELEKKPILLLLEEAGVNVARAEQAITAKLADSVVAKHLDVQVGSALLGVKRVIYDEHDRPLQWLSGLYRPDRYEYQMQLSRVGSIKAKVWVSKELSARFH